MHKIPGNYLLPDWPRSAAAESHSLPAGRISLVVRAVRQMLRAACRGLLGRPVWRLSGIRRVPVGLAIVIGWCSLNCVCNRVVSRMHACMAGAIVPIRRMAGMGE
jgi:hypothetical protein